MNDFNAIICEYKFDTNAWLAAKGSQEASLNSMKKWLILLLVGVVSILFIISYDQNMAEQKALEEKERNERNVHPPSETAQFQEDLSAALERKKQRDLDKFVEGDFLR